MFKTIMVPLDGSILAECALPLATELARKFDAGLVLVRAFRPLSSAPVVFSIAAAGPMAPYAFEETTRAQQDDAKTYLDDRVAALRGSGLKVSSRVLEGPVVEKLAETAHELPSALVVMTSRGRSGFKRLVLGSVTDALLHRIEIPIFVIPSRPDQTRP